MINALFAVGRLSYAAISGVDELVDAGVRLGVKLALKSRKVDDDTGEAMVEAMRADAPQLTGRLVNGITTFRDPSNDAVTVVQSSALRTSGGQDWDYAPFVERGHGAAEAEPYFYADAESVLQARGTDLEDALASAAQEEGF